METVHRLQEDEFFDREGFIGRAEFWAKVITYWRYFNPARSGINIARPNRNKEWKTPLQILRERNPELDPAIASWRPLDLGAELSQYFPRYSPKRGHDLPVHP